jgi:cytochrome c-type biogenesis protein
MLSISVPLAFLAGLLSFLSPCLLPLVPIYLGYLSGSSLSGETSVNRKQVFLHALSFVGGFTLVFILLFGLPTTLLGSALQDYKEWITRIGGAALILFGLHTLGAFTLPFLNLTRRLEADVGERPGYFRSTVVGITFAAGWTPCIGPLLGTVMTLALTEPSKGIGLTIIYALGLAVPFLVTAALLTPAVGWLKKLNRHMRAVEIVSGVLMIAIGILLVSGQFFRLNSLLVRFTPKWLLEHL